MQAMNRYFSESYAQARERFLSAARPLAAHVQSYAIDPQGSQDEPLATDVALIGDADARRLLIMTSATHGVEGFCGSGCQLALLDDAPLLERARRAGVALLLVHAVNPYGFSWIARTDEGNVDLNRNAQPFDGQPLPANPGYGEIHGLLLPSEWPPTEQNRQAIARHLEKHGLPATTQAVSRGQYTHADGLFYGGDRHAPSLLNLRAILQAHASRYGQIGWIDVHTGLGPRGHGEKIYAGRRDDAEVARARQWWGSDIAVPYQGSSASVDITGHLAGLIYQVCPDSVPTLMALEFGTLPWEGVVHALRGRNWLRAHPEAGDTLRREILQATLDAFYCGQEDWQGMVLGQSRVAVLQALCGLEAGQ
ncbi:M14 family metallopeptidase [Achromobacter deleyi]|uniref:M14 family metallopeptidase n=1 Tax=Achromobacter deleyi TaxID=1353891 RepID=UPI001492F951|nr:M14 family metallopeptidase [Achromobacter deleyi]QVQ25845.1 M14 family metallopeptidase [Achromobacter deleyi]UIP21384.1 M14 family metallopeptidase [Achromobacter deleyi]